MTASAPFRDSALPIAARVADLLDRMTLAEKIGQMLQLDARDDLVDIVAGKLVGSVLHASPERIKQAQQLAAATRLGIPLLVADDVIHGYSFWPGATVLPTQLAQACTWDPELVRAGARITAAEVATTGVHWTFAPVLCIARDPRWGRVGETFGEDPYLIGVLGAAAVAGYQGDGLADPTAIMACAKHFAGYSETQGGRDASEADLTPRKLRSWFLPPFERAARAGCATFMIGYQAMDGVPITANRWLLTDVLRGEWDYRGTLVTDWDNVGRMVWEQKVSPDLVAAAVAAVRAGNDLVMTTPGFATAAARAVEQGRLAEAEIDAAVARILHLKFQLGLFEDPRLPDPAAQAEVIACPAHQELNLQVARRSLVLLANDGLLPLDPAGPSRRIALVGPNADDPQALLGDWAGASGQVDWLPDGHPRECHETVLDGLRAVLPAGWQVDHTPGAAIAELAPDPAGALFPDGQPRPPVILPAPDHPELREAAVAAALAADVVVAVVGDTVGLFGECRSTATLELVGGQVALLEALVATGRPVIVVLMASKPMVLPAAVDRAAALVVAFSPGMRGGRAIAELLLGLIEPSGRLPISFPRHAGQLPTYYNQVRGQHGDRYADLTQEPAHPFGAGLSYTTVAYRDLVLEAQSYGEPDTVRASLTLANSGSRPALETVQVYVRDEVTSVTWADLELKGFQQVEVPAGAQVKVIVELPVSACTIVDAAGVRRVEPGRFELLVGPSSRADMLLGAGFEVVPG